LAYRAGVPVRAGHFLAEATELAATLAPGRHVLNVCTDRYHFAVGLVAALMARKLSLLPSTHAPLAIRRLRETAPDVFALTDDPQHALDVPQVRYPSSRRRRFPLWPPRQIAGGELVAQVFTSGSTGQPIPHGKTWGRMAQGVRAGAQLLGLSEGMSHAIVATVPPQHMYGLESSVLLPLLSGNALCAERPFYPADICAALAAVPPPRVLISTPVHLRTLLAADLSLPPSLLIVSATAALSRELACDVERRFATRLLEIYGSTESGQLAVRRTAQNELWQLWPGVMLAERDGQVWAQGGHVEQPTPLCDVIELRDAGSFLLHGRLTDLVNIAGKRSSLAYLNHQLHSIQGVLDGAFFHLEETAVSHTGVTRIAAIVAAPGLSASGVIEELRRRIDPVFLPRPLLLVERLPRNSTGKLPLEDLRSLAANHLRATGEMG
jgi:acyl-coenzyme A synthetase/AMP-(fatty) acid ligase